MGKSKGYNMGQIKAHIKKKGKELLLLLGFCIFCTINAVKIVKNNIEISEFKFQSNAG